MSSCGFEFHYDVIKKSVEDQTIVNKIEFHSAAFGSEAN